MWRLEMKSGTSIGIWALGYSEVDGNYVFDVYLEATEAEQKDRDLVITAHTPADPEKVMVAVASIPVDEVEDIHTTSWDKIPQPLVSA